MNENSTVNGSATRWLAAVAPVAALAPGAVAWQRQIQGTRYSVWVQRLAPGPTSASPALQVPTGDPAGPFRPALARVRDDAWLVLWSEGPRSPDYRVFGRFVSP